MSLQVTIVGCGAVAQRLYRKPLRELEGRGMLRVAGLVDPLADHAAALGAYFPKAGVYRNLDDALAASRTDLTLILSPAHLHCSQAIQALRHESHVLCEKPMAATADDCLRMNTVAAELGRILAVAMVRRFFPAHAQLRQIVQNGELGPLDSFEYREGHKFEWDVTTPTAFRPRNQGGTGVLFDIGPHVVDYLAWTFGCLNVVAYRDDALAGIESNLSMTLESPVCRGTIDLSWDTPQTNELRVIGSRGEAVLRIDRFDQLALSAASKFEPQRIDVSFPADELQPARRRISPRSYPEAILCQLVQVIRAIRLREPPAVDGNAGARCVALLESALAIARPLNVPWLNSKQQDAFRRLHWKSGA
jgi:predicted dehydrogenase